MAGSKDVWRPHGSISPSSHVHQQTDQAIDFLPPLGSRRRIDNSKNSRHRLGPQGEGSTALGFPCIRTVPGLYKIFMSVSVFYKMSLPCFPSKRILITTDPCAGHKNVDRKSSRRVPARSFLYLVIIWTSNVSNDVFVEDAAFFCFFLGRGNI